METQIFKSQMQEFSWYNTLELNNENMSSLTLLDCEKQFIYFFKPSILRDQLKI